MTVIKSVVAAACAAVCAISIISAANAVTIDGEYEAAYGAPTAIVNTDPAAPTSNFGAPGTTNAIGYSIYLTSDSNNLYGLLRATSSAAGLLFANAYFDLDRSTNPGSDLGIEITNDRAFIPGGPAGAYSAPLGITFATSVDNQGLEFAIPLLLLTAPIPSLPDAGQVYSDTIVLRLLQAYGYSVAGGESYGPDRLGSLELSEVPLPAALPLFASALIGAGTMAWRRRKKVAA